MKTIYRSNSFVLIFICFSGHSRRTEENDAANFRTLGNFSLAHCTILSFHCSDYGHPLSWRLVLLVQRLKISYSALLAKFNIIIPASFRLRLFFVSSCFLTSLSFEHSETINRFKSYSPFSSSLFSVSRTRTALLSLPDGVLLAALP